MKKFIILTLLLCLIPLGGCNRRLENDYFENKKNNSIQEVIELLDTHSQTFEDEFYATHPFDLDQYQLRENDGYVHSYINPNSFYRNDLLNYNLMDHRSQMHQRSFAIKKAIQSLKQVDNILEDRCDEKLKEATICGGNDYSYTLIYYMEEQSLLISFLDQDSTEELSYEYMFEVVDDHLMLTFDYSEVRLGDRDLTHTMSLEYKENHFFRTSYDIFDKGTKGSSEVNNDYTRYTYFDLTEQKYYEYLNHTRDNEEQLVYFDLSEGELYQINRMLPFEFSQFVYQEYDQKRLVVQYLDSDHIYGSTINLMEFPGWDYIERDSYPEPYTIYYAGEQIEDVFIEVNVEYLENVFLILEPNDSIYDVLLNKFGVTSKFTEDYFNSKKDFIMQKYYTLVDEAGFERIK